MSLSRQALILERDALRLITDRGISLPKKRGKGIEIMSRIFEACLAAEVDVSDALQALEASQALRWQIVMLNRRYAYLFAKKWDASMGEDTFSESLLGVYDAACRFDPDRGFKFATYAKWWARARMERNLSPHELPSGARDILRKIRQYERLGWNDARIAEELGTSTLRLAKIRIRSTPLLPMDCPTSPGSQAMAESVPCEIVETDEMGVRSLREALVMLPDRDQEVLRLRYGFGRADTASLTEVAEQFGVTRTRIQQIEKKAILALREILLEVS